MSRKILLAWELGGGLGHATRVAAVARALARRGYEPILAVQRLDSLDVLGLAPEFAGALQAPLWPGLRPGAPPQTFGPQATIGDALGDLGLMDASAVASLIGQWDEMFARVCPLAVVADFAPTALLAGLGRFPMVAIGSGYALPPSDMPEFPVLRSDVVERKHGEQDMLRAVNAALVETGRNQIDRLPAIFSADRVCVASFAEIDPYGTIRTAPHIAPFLPSWSREPARSGREIFVYFPEFIASYPATIFAVEHIARTGRAVRVFVPRLEPTIAARFTAAGAVVETTAVPLDHVAERTSLILFYGGLGMASFALAAGIPQIIVAIDTEKTLIGRAIERLGAGRHVRLANNNPLEGPLLAQFILEASVDEKLAASARSLAPQFAMRLSQDPAECIAQEVVELLERRAG